MLGENLNEIESIVSEIILKDYIPIHKGNYNIIAGDGGTGKSQVALKMIAHFLQANPDQKAVGIFTEDTKAVIEARLDVITRYMHINTQEVIKRTFFKTLDNFDGKVFAKKLQRENVLIQDYVDSFIMNARLHNIGLVVFDPLEAFHEGLSENDNEDMKFYVTQVFQKLGVETGAGVVVLHHTNKGDKSGSRGARVITNKARVAYNIRKLTEHDKDLGVDVPKKGWENSVFLSTIKDNHFISRDCRAIQHDKGKLVLPVYDNTSNEPLIQVFGELEDSLRGILD